MALLTAQGIARVAISLLTRTLVLPRTATLVPAAGFSGPNGETISVRVRQPRTANTQGSPGASISYADQNEISVDVTLAHLYDAYHLTDEDANLVLEDFASQITAPQVAAVAVGAEDQLAAAMNTLAVNIEFAGTATESDTKATLLEARERLGDADVPPSDRFLAVSPSIATRLLSVDQFTKVNESGSASALRQAVLGSLYGFTVLESNALTTDTALAYHRSGFVFATKTPMNPRGAVSSAAVSEQGINMRQIFQYDPDVLSDASVLSTFAGAAAVHDEESPSERSPGESPSEDSYPRIVKIGVGS